METSGITDQAETEERTGGLGRGGGTRPENEFLPLDRFQGFTDGVLAIVITLLVLELTVPAPGESLLPALSEQLHEFLGYVISFVFVGAIWVAHAEMTKLMREADSISYGINLLMLLFIGVLPFSTNLMVTHLQGPDVSEAVIIYGINLLLASGLMSLLMFYVASERSLVADTVADSELQARVRQRWVAIVSNVVAIAIALVLPLVAVGLYLLITLVGLILPLVRLRRHR